MAEVVGVEVNSGSDQHEEQQSIDQPEIQQENHDHENNGDLKSSTSIELNSNGNTPPNNIPVATMPTSAAAQLFPSPPPLPQNEGSPTLKNDPQKRRNSYKDVESRLFQSTAATNNGKWQGGQLSPPPPNRNQIKQPIFTPSPSQGGGGGGGGGGGEISAENNHHIYETPTPPTSEKTYFKDVPSRLHETTVATSNGKWVNTKSNLETEKNDLPKFNTSVRRASMGELIVPQEKEKSTWKDPYKDTVQSRLFSPTIATTQGQWKSQEDGGGGGGGAGNSESTPADTTTSPNDKARRRFSTTILPSDLSTLHELPSSGKASPYDNVKTRLHLQTAAVKNAKWTGGSSANSVGGSDSHTPEPPRFVSTFNKKSEFPSPAPSTPNSNNEQYKDVKPRLYETTAAMENGKYAGPEVNLDSTLPKFDTSVRRSSVIVSDFNTPPPVPENHRYRNVQSRLQHPTTASKESAWKSPEEQKTPEQLTPPSSSITSSSPPTRLLKPTVSSLHHVWPSAPGAPPCSPPNTCQPQLIKSKAYENVGSRLLCPTASYLAKYTVVEDDGSPKVAFGHPIEPEYLNLHKKSPRLSSGGGHSPGAAHSPSRLSPSRSLSSDPH